MMGVKERVAALIRIISSGLKDRDDIIRICVLGVLSGQNIFLYGPPGTGKSLISRRLSSLFHSSRYFEHLMHRFCTPEELFGPVSLKELKNDNYHRLTKGYLAEADFAFLDEIWKSSPAVLNTLLTLVNERCYHNGARTISSPLKSLVSASNEVPLHEAGLDALYDRFLVRLAVNPVRSQELFKSMITDANTGYQAYMDPLLKVTDQDYSQWMSMIATVKLPDRIADAIVHMREIIMEQVDLADLDRNNYGDEYDLDGDDEDGENDSPDAEYGHLSYVSDRRWFQIIRFIKASAFFNGRREVGICDLFPLRFCLWNNSSDKDSFNTLVLDTIREYSAGDLVPADLKERLSQKSASEDKIVAELMRHLRSCSASFSSLCDSLRRSNIEILTRGKDLYFDQKDDPQLRFSTRVGISSVTKISFESALTEMHLEIGQKIRCQVIKSDIRTILKCGVMECLPNEGFDVSGIENGKSVTMRLVKIDRDRRLLLVRPDEESVRYWMPVLNYELGVVYHSIYNSRFERQTSMNFVIDSAGEEVLKITIRTQDKPVVKYIRSADAKKFMELIRLNNQKLQLADEINEQFARFDRLFDEIMSGIDNELFLTVEDKKFLKELVFDQVPDARRAKDEFMELMNAGEGK